MKTKATQYTNDITNRDGVGIGGNITATPCGKGV